ncbi:hypothetical protein DFJ77DRAFT_548295 [Powellomyces hirtus]|nr:hypothetical protein DFJ77DRAFT_548295 [Powellomyces hirtus]
MPAHNHIDLTRDENGGKLPQATSSTKMNANTGQPSRPRKDSRQNVKPTPIIPNRKRKPVEANESPKVTKPLQPNQGRQTEDVINETRERHRDHPRHQQHRDRAHPHNQRQSFAAPVIQDDDIANTSDGFSDIGSMDNANVGHASSIVSADTESSDEGCERMVTDDMVEDAHAKSSLPSLLRRRPLTSAEDVAKRLANISGVELIDQENSLVVINEQPVSLRQMVLVLHHFLIPLQTAKNQYARQTLLNGPAMPLADILSILNMLCYRQPRRVLLGARTPAALAFANWIQAKLAQEVNPSISIRWRMILGWIDDECGANIHDPPAPEPQSIPGPYCFFEAAAPTTLTLLTASLTPTPTPSTSSTVTSSSILSLFDGAHEPTYAKPPPPKRDVLRRVILEKVAEEVGEDHRDLVKAAIRWLECLWGVHEVDWTFEPKYLGDEDMAETQQMESTHHTEMEDHHQENGVGNVEDGW